MHSLTVHLICLLFKYSTWKDVILPPLLPPFHSFLFCQGNKHYDTKVIPQTSYFSDSLSSGQRNPNNQNKMGILCLCQCQLYISESILISVLFGVLLIWPFGDGIHDGVLNFYGHLKVVQHGTHSTACLRKRKELPQGPDLILKIIPVSLANEVKTDPSIVIYHNLFMMVCLLKLLPK